MNLSRVSQLEFPTFPDEELSNPEVREAYAKGSAYVTLALETAGYSHTRPEYAAAVTDIAHTLEEDNDPSKYLELAHQEVAFAVEEAEVEWFERDLEFVRQTIASAQ